MQTTVLTGKAGNTGSKSRREAIEVILSEVPSSYYVNRPSNGAHGTTAYHSDKADQEEQLVCALLQYSYLMDIHERAALRAPVHISLSSAEPEDDTLVRAPVHT
jgi:hypothetical protein